MYGAGTKIKFFVKMTRDHRLHPVPRVLGLAAAAGDMKVSQFLQQFFVIAETGGKSLLAEREKKKKRGSHDNLANVYQKACGIYKTK